MNLRSLLQVSSWLCLMQVLRYPLVLEAQPEVAPIPPPAVSVAGADQVAAITTAANDLPRGDVAAGLVKARALYLAGDSAGAEELFRKIEKAAPGNATTAKFLRQIAEDKARAGEITVERARAEMVDEVAKSWQRPGVYEERAAVRTVATAPTLPLAQKLATIQIPSVSFNEVDLNRVAQSLSAISEEFDPGEDRATRGVNIVLLDPANRNPLITLSLRNLSLKRVLDFITDSVGYQYEVQADAVVLRPGGETSVLDTAFFPIARSTVIRMTGFGSAQTPPTGVTSAADPFSLSAASSRSGPQGSNEAGALRAFLQSAGVSFDGVNGASLAYDGSAMIVTQTTRNIERIRTILNRYNDVRQVEIEAKFMEVQDGALEELGVGWNVSRKGQTFTTNGVTRSLAGAFTGSSNGNSIVIDGQSVASTAPPRLPGAVALAGEASGFASISGMVGDFNVSAMVRALAQKAGSDLLSAPRVTVLSGNTATITVAQELRYPQSYGEIQSQVGSGRTAGDTGGAGSAGVTVTAGTPQDFTTRNVGVELKVTPTVEEDDYSISLDLVPKVTEFDGFVEYGGPSVAVSGGKTVTVPPGFYQPIFSVREVSTKVTLWDGATLVMGGLTREEVKRVSDKVPVLGDIPLFGRAFRSKGQSAQKRNLLIFVTANLVSPGGSPKKQAVGGVQPSTLFQNPTIVTPAKVETRGSEK